MSDPDRRLNLTVGIVSLALVAALVAGLSIRAALSVETVPPISLVAYFDDSGGLRAGDAVRVSGRRAGVVSDVSLVQHQGRPRVRVEFIVRPGEGSQWLYDGLGTDTSVRIDPGGIRSGPRLVLSAGKEAAKLASGDEVRFTTARPKPDEMAEYMADLREIRGFIARGVEVLDRPQVQEALEMIGRLRVQVEALSEPLEGAIGQGPEVSKALDQVRADMEAAAASAHSAREELHLAAAGAAGNATLLDDSLVRAQHGLEEFNSGLGRLATSVGELAKGMDSAGNQDLGRELRAMSARLKASQESSARDPSRMGNDVPRRFARPHYFGDNFKPGNNLNDKDDSRKP